MTVTTMEILGRDGADRPILPLLRKRRDALAAYCVRRWPSTGRRKAVMAEWSLTNDEARAVLEATSSEATWEKIMAHPQGGWAVILPIIGAVTGVALDDFITSERERIARDQLAADARARRLSAMARDLPSLLSPRRGAADRLAGDEAGRRRRAAGGRDPGRHQSAAG